MITDSVSEIVYVPYSEAYAIGFEDMARRVPDTERLNALIGWRPEVSLDQLLVRIRDHLQVRVHGARSD